MRFSAKSITIQKSLDVLFVVDLTQDTSLKVTLTSDHDGSLASGVELQTGLDAGSPGSPIEIKFQVIEGPSGAEGFKVWVNGVHMRDVNLVSYGDLGHTFTVVSDESASADLIMIEFEISKILKFVLNIYLYVNYVYS